MERRRQEIIIRHRAAILRIILETPTFSGFYGERCVDIREIGLIIVGFALGKLRIYARPSNPMCLAAILDETLN